MADGSRASETSAGLAKWTGKRKIPVNTAGRWRIGPLELLVAHLAGEWQVSHVQDTDPLDASFSEDLDLDVSIMENRAEVRRYLQAEQGDEIILEAALADRYVVTFSRQPLLVCPGQRVTVYVSTPLWLRIRLGVPDVLLEELPLFRPSDTWFGPDSQEGELCYASSTSHRLSLDGIPARPHRATTAVHVWNRARSNLNLSKLKVPVPLLELYQAGDGRFWTTDVVLERTSDDYLGTLRLDRTAPGALHGDTGGRRISGPREEKTGSLIFRAFGALFR